MQPPAALPLEREQVPPSKALRPPLSHSKDKVRQEVTTQTEPTTVSQITHGTQPSHDEYLRRLEELRAAGKVREEIYQKVREEYLKKDKVQSTAISQLDIASQATSTKAPLQPQSKGEGLQQPTVPTRSSTTSVEELKSPEASAKKPLPTPKPEQNILTGYRELDLLLSGRLPEGYAVVFVSPSYDERDLLLRRFIESVLNSGRTTFFMSGDMATTKELIGTYQKNFFAFSPQADKIASENENLQKIPGVENLSDLNISMAKATANLHLPKTVSKILIVDVLSDVLLHHKALTTRRWLADFVAKRKAEGFTIVCTINPLIAKEDTQTITDLFDGIIEIYEKELEERTRRFITVKKMHGRKYSETELMLDKDKLF